MFARVIVDIAHSGVDRVFEYAVPEGMALEAGFRVRVPFGKGDALREGYVLSLTETCKYDESQIKPIRSVISDYAALTHGQIRLATMVRRYYHTTLAAALRLMFPAEMRGGRVKDRFERELACNLKGGELEKAFASLKRAPKQRAVLEIVSGRTMMAQELERRLPGSAPAREALIKKGFIQAVRKETFRVPQRNARVEKDYALDGRPAKRGGYHYLRHGQIPAARRDGQRQDGGLYPHRAKLP